jgi:transposase
LATRPVRRRSALLNVGSILWFDPRREHSSIPTAKSRSRRAQGLSRLAASSRPPEGLGLDWPEHGGTLDRLGWRLPTQWSCRSMAEVSGISKASVQRVWRANGLKPHLLKTFKLSNDPNFIEKLEDVIGLYMSPPDHALVFCIDEKSQIQALDRTQPGLPMKKGRAGTMTHDYKRNGTTTLFAALDVLKGEVIGRCMPQHRHQEFLKFLQAIDRSTPKHLDIHGIADNYATHKKQQVKDWLAKHPRFHLHFIPTSSSWLNLVERWFGKITTERIRRGTFTSVAELERAIYDYIEHNNANPKPFVWTKSANDIILKVNRGRAALKMPPLMRRDQL